MFAKKIAVALDWLPNNTSEWLLWQPEYLLHSIKLYSINKILVAMKSVEKCKCSYFKLAQVTSCWRHQAITWTNVEGEVDRARNTSRLALHG